MNRLLRSTRVPIALQTNQKITLPMARNGAIGDLRWPLADQRLRGDMGPRLLPGSRPRDPQRPAPAQAADQLPFERTAALHVERLVDGLVADLHRLIIGEIDL